MQTVSRVVLMDFDGVLLRDPRVLRRVQQRVVQYVQRNVHKGYLSEAEAVRVNRDLYQRYGHTHLGMKKLFMPHARLTTFNGFVYDPGFLNELYREFGRDDEVLNGIRAWDTWFDEQLNEGDVDKLAIFTNSPAAWPTMWLEAAGRLGQFQEILGSDHVLFEGRTDSLLKPDKNLYLRMETYHDPHQALYFVDDSLGNLEPLVQRPQWIPMLFDGDDVVKFGGRSDSV
jgi:FMN phosphatase YigB (HAD superfamily)